MKRLLLVILALGLSLGLLPALGADAAAPAPAPVHSVSVTGEGVAMYPAFDASIARYGVTTTASKAATETTPAVPGTEGTVTVHATTSDPAGSVRINGRPSPDGTRTLTGLSEGDEIAVFIEDSAGTERHSLVYLPTDFPALQQVTDVTADDPDLQPGMVLVTLGKWITPSPFFEAALDVNGVPAMVHATTYSIDFKRAANGNYSVGRNTTTSGRSGQAVTELDSQFRPIGSYETQGQAEPGDPGTHDLTNTDGHDSILLPDGSRYLISLDLADGAYDAVIQEIDPAGDVTFTWNSKDHLTPADETVVDASPPGTGDYNHINSLQVMDDGDLLVSFRHFSAVYKIARTAHDGYAQGDVVWKLGGRNSTFTFPNDQYGGPCAQHDATEMPNGNILMFDNGSANFTGRFCVDPEARHGAVVQRPFTRAVEYDLDTGASTATVAWEYDIPAVDTANAWFANFAGSAQRVANGDTVIGWAAERRAITTEVDAAGQVVWGLKDPQKAYFSYRAVKADVPDAQAPVVTLDTPADGATFAFGSDPAAPTFDCTDRGGSSLQTCSSSAIDTSRAGTHSYKVTATDGAGNTTTRRRSYTVLPSPYRPDAQIRTKSGGTFKSTVSSTIRPRATAVAVVRLRNDGTKADRLTLARTPDSKAFHLTYDLPGDARRPPKLEPGQTWTFRVEVVRTPAAPAGAQRTFKITATSAHQSGSRDQVAFQVRAR